MFRTTGLVSLVGVLIAAYTVVSNENSAAVCTPPDEASDGSRPLCKEHDQNALLQGRVQVLQPKDGPASLEQQGHVVMPAYKAVTSEALPGDELKIMGLPSPLSMPLPPASPIDKMAMSPGVAFEKFAENAPAPRGWFLVPALCSFFLLLMQCTDTHPDSYGMEEEEKDDTTRPPRRTDRLPLFDIARFGLIVGIIWTQLMLAFGHSVMTSALHEFVWPAWFFLAGIFGSSLTYESVARVMCYSITTNCLLASIGTVFAFFNYESQALPFSAFFGGAWVLWCLLLYRLTITPLFHIARGLPVPAVPACGCLLSLIVIFSYVSRSHMALTNVVVDLHARQIEHLLLMVKTYDATIRSALLNAPYFAAGLLMTPTQWNSLLSSTWFTCAAAGNGLVWFVLTVTPLLCSLGHWHCERPWGVKLLIHADSLSGFTEDAVCYVQRMSAVLLLLCCLFAVASFLTRVAPTLSAYIGGCGSRIRYTITLFALWYMIRPCMLHPPQLPFHRSPGINDLTMGFPALLIALILTSSGTQQLFRWVVEPYWAKCFIEGSCKHLAEHFRDLRRTDDSVSKSKLFLSQQQNLPAAASWVTSMQMNAETVD